MTLSEVDALVRMARELGVKRMRLGDCEFELGAAVAESQFDASDVMCQCGHHLVTEHNEHGCLKGCSNDLCSSEPAEA